MPDTDARLSKIESKLDKIDVTLTKIAVQDERLRHVETAVAALGRKYDIFCGLGGALDGIKSYQSSCPRNQIKFLWMAMIPLCLTLLASAYALIQLVEHKP